MTKKKGTLPKRIAGVKIPKELRRKGDALIEKANSPAGREAIAAGLTMAAAAASAAVAKRAAAKPAPAEEQPAPGAAPSGTTKAPDPQAIAAAVSQAAEAVLGKFFAARKP